MGKGDFKQTIGITFPETEEDHSREKQNRGYGQLPGQQQKVSAGFVCCHSFEQTRYQLQNNFSEDKKKSLFMPFLSPPICRTCMCYHWFPTTLSFSSFCLHFRFYLVSGGVPLIIVGVTAAVSLDNYGSRDDAP